MISSPDGACEVKRRMSISLLARGPPALAGGGIASQCCSDPGCAHGSAAHSRSGSILVVARGDRRESLNLRVSPDLKRQIEAYAERVGISINAAACVLLAEGLRAERRRER